MTDTTWSQDDVFPIIRRIIRRVHSQTQEFVTHQEMVDALLEDPAGRHEVSSAQGEQHGVREEQIASNMIAWFSQRMTVGDSPADARTFERVKIRRRWAYRPRQIPVATPVTSDPSPENRREQGLNSVMSRRYLEEIPAETGYRPMRMVEMIELHGALETVRRLMARYVGFASEGYTRLSECGRLDLSFEALMHDPRFTPLFSKDELQWARRRLAEYGYTVPGGFE